MVLTTWLYLESKVVLVLAVQATSHSDLGCHISLLLALGLVDQAQLRQVLGSHTGECVLGTPAWGGWASWGPMTVVWGNWVSGSGLGKASPHPNRPPAPVQSQHSHQL